MFSVLLVGSVGRHLWPRHQNSNPTFLRKYLAKNIKSVFVSTLVSNTHSQGWSGTERCDRLYRLRCGTAASLTTDNSRHESIGELVNPVFMCILAFRFNGFVIENFSHLWKSIILCPGSQGDDVQNSNVYTSSSMCVLHFSGPFKWVILLNFRNNAAT